MVVKINRDAKSRTLVRTGATIVLSFLVLTLLVWNFEVVKLGTRFVIQEVALLNDADAAASAFPDCFSRTHDGKKYTGQRFQAANVAAARQLMIIERGVALPDLQVLKSDPVFVSAFSDNHADEGFVMLRKIRAVYQDRNKVVVYNLGLNQNNLNLSKRDYADVILEMKDFPFDRFPSHVANLKEYRWKPLIVAMELQLHPTIFWMDSSTVHRQPLSRLLRHFQTCDGPAHLCQFYPWVLFDYTGHSIFAATSKMMLNFLPLPDDMAKEVAMIGANIQLVYGTARTRRDVLYWWALCALEQDCLAPADAQLRCSFGSDRFNSSGHCHRFDQSAVNILVEWAVGFDLYRVYNTTMSDWVVAQRG